MNKNIQNLISTLEKIDNFDYLNNIEVILNKILARLKNGGIIYLAEMEDRSFNPNILLLS